MSQSEYTVLPEAPALAVRLLASEKISVQNRMDSVLQDISHRIKLVTVERSTHQATQISVLGIELVTLTERLAMLQTWGDIFSQDSS